MSAGRPGEGPRRRVQRAVDMCELAPDPPQNRREAVACRLAWWPTAMGVMSVRLAVDASAPGPAQILGMLQPSGRSRPDVGPLLPSVGEARAKSGPTPKANGAGQI